MQRSDSASGVWRALRTADGSLTLEHTGLGQACHSMSGAWLEACERYARPCKLRERALSMERGNLRLLDIGTGLGVNLAAALQALDGTGCALEAVSMEVDPSVIRAALAEELRPTDPGAVWCELVRAALRQALEDPARAASPAGIPFGHSAGVGGGQPSTLRLVIGDARRELPRLEEAAVFDAVFLDAFSPGVDPPLWERAFLTEVARRMAPGSWLSTYTASMAVRARLRAAGLAVGRGERLEAKGAGTLAARDGEPPELDPRQQRKLAARVRRMVAGGE